MANHKMYKYVLLSVSISYFKSIVTTSLQVVNNIYLKTKINVRLKPEMNESKRRLTFKEERPLKKPKLESKIDIKSGI